MFTSYVKNNTQALGKITSNSLPLHINSSEILMSIIKCIMFKRLLLSCILFLFFLFYFLFIHFTSQSKRHIVLSSQPHTSVPLCPSLSLLLREGKGPCPLLTHPGTSVLFRNKSTLYHQGQTRQLRQGKGI